MDTISTYKPIAHSQYGTPSENMLILGENLRVLKNISDEFQGKIQCIYLDPPYNSCNSFNMFMDCLPQDEWEKTMKERLEKLWPFLCESGSIWISIDDSEFADLKVLCDKLWGRDHFILTIVRQKNKYPSSAERAIVHMHDYILVYAKDPMCVKLHDISLEDGSVVWNYPHKEWALENLLIRISALKQEQCVENYVYPVDGPSGDSIFPPKGRCWCVTQDEYKSLKDTGAIWFDANAGYPLIKRSIHQKKNVRPTSLWLESEIGSNQEARYEILKYDTGMFFYVPKPEKLLYRILSICTDPGDWVLDAYLGSGTTAAVAQKMSRRWIGIEREQEQFENICVPRLNDVIRGRDNTAVTKLTKWCGGGGFSCVVIDNK